jgi:hypothetical protein
MVNCVWRFVLSRRWWAGHVLVAAGCGLFLGLARWQWDRAHSITGDWQNLGYALQWPLFAVVLLAAWLRFLWLEQHRGPVELPPDVGEHPGPAPETASVPLPPAREAARPAVRGSAPGEDNPDDELAAYNAYLAQLAEQDQRR